MSNNSRFLLVIYLTLAMVCLSQAQITMTGAGLGAPAGGFSASCTQSSNFLARATSVVSNTDKTNYNSLLCGLETDGVGCSNTLDALYVYMAVDVVTAKLNLCSASFAITSHGTNVDTSGFTQYVGFTGNGSDRYLDTGMNPSTAGGFYVLNSASYGTCISTTNTGTLAEMGQNATSTGSRLIPAFAGNLAVMKINQTTQDTFSNSSVAGLWHIDRTGASAVTYYLSGSSLATSATSSSSVDSDNFFVLAENVAGTPTNLSTNQHLASFIGKGMNGTQVGNLRARVNTFATAYSKSC